MLAADFDYPLPAELIAQRPAEPRDRSRLLVLDRATGEIRHRQFRDITEFLRPGDVLVANDTKVLPAALHGVRVDTGQKIEVLLLGERSPGEWAALGKPIRRLAPGASLMFGDDELHATALERTSTGEIVIGFRDDPATVTAALTRLGETPLPPYIHAKLAHPDEYQTVFATKPGAVAAPTAGLHFTPELLANIDALGVERVFVTLHVGLYTFRSVLTERVEDHVIHREWFELASETAAALNRARAEGRRIVVVGTTTVRVLETVGQAGFPLVAQRGWTRVFITPGFRFQVVDALITNFHMPRSTLMLLVSAFASREQIMRAYAVAIANRYRFYSFGDAMLML